MHSSAFMKSSRLEPLKAKQLIGSAFSKMVTGTTTIIKHLAFGVVVLLWLLHYFLNLPSFFFWGALCGVGVLFMAALCKWTDTHTHTHTHTLSQDERAVTLPANMILQPWVEWVVEERMRTEYKRGKPLDLQVPAVRRQTMSQHTFLK